MEGAGLTMSSFKESLKKHKISFDDINAKRKTIEKTVNETNDKVDRMFAARPQPVDPPPRA